MKYLGIDYGTKRIGLAFSPDGKFVWSLPFVDQPGLEKISEVILKESIETIVIGTTFQTNGMTSKMGLQSKQFAEELKEKTKANIIILDEAMTSICAKDLLKPLNLSSKKLKSRIDSLSAKLLLEMYIETL